jgi:hypothetical protein
MGLEKLLPRTADYRDLIFTFETEVFGGAATKAGRLGTAGKMPALLLLCFEFLTERSAELRLTIFV